MSPAIEEGVRVTLNDGRVGTAPLTFTPDPLRIKDGWWLAWHPKTGGVLRIDAASRWKTRDWRRIPDPWIDNVSTLAGHCRVVEAGWCGATDPDGVLRFLDMDTVTTLTMLARMVPARHGVICDFVGREDLDAPPLLSANNPEMAELQRVEWRHARTVAATDAARDAPERETRCHARMQNGRIRLVQETTFDATMADLAVLARFLFGQDLETLASEWRPRLLADPDNRDATAAQIAGGIREEAAQLLETERTARIEAEWARLAVASSHARKVGERAASEGLTPATFNHSLSLLDQDYRAKVMLHSLGVEDVGPDILTASGWDPALIEEVARRAPRGQGHPWFP